MGAILLAGCAERRGNRWFWAACGFLWGGMISCGTQRGNPPAGPWFLGAGLCVGRAHSTHRKAECHSAAGCHPAPRITRDSLIESARVFSTPYGARWEA
jgi:hypothetical protein